MKKYIYILAASAVVLACSKESVTEEPAEIETPGEVHELFVSLPEMTDPDTKAAISTTDGKFTWTAGDAIAVKTSTNHTYKFIAASNSSSGSSNAVRFTYTGAMDGTPATIYYPWKDTTPHYEDQLPTSIDALDGALSEDYIRLSGTVSNNSATLSYTNAFLKVKFTNVPTFASKVKFESLASGYEQTVLVSGISLSSKGTVEAYIPVKAGNYKFSVYLVDTADNYMFGRTTTKTLTAGSLLKMASTELGHVLTIDPNGWQDKNKYLYIWQSDNTSNNYKFRIYDEGGAYPYQLNILNDHAFYVILDPKRHLNSSNNEWLSEGLGIGVAFQMGNSGNSSETPRVFLYRDITLTPVYVSSTGLKTNYRTYLNKRSDNAKNNWGSVAKVHIKTAGSYTGEYTMTSQTTDLFYYENSADDFNKSMSYRFHNTHGWYPTGAGSEDYWTYTLNQEYIYDVD